MATCDIICKYTHDNDNNYIQQKDYTTFEINAVKPRVQEHTCTA